MMPVLNRSFLALAFATVAACATGQNGSVLMKVSETEAHVSLADDDAPVGTLVQVYRRTCWQQYEKPGTPGAARIPYVCEKEPMAVGTITRRMGARYAHVVFPRGTQYEEGYVVEPISHPAPDDSDLSASR